MTVSKFFVELIRNAPTGRFLSQLLECVLAVVQSPLFQLSECRNVLMPFICQYLHELYMAKRDLGGCAVVISEMLMLLSASGVGPTHKDLSILIDTLLPDVVETVIQLDENSPVVSQGLKWEVGQLNVRVLCTCILAPS